MTALFQGIRRLTLAGVMLIAICFGALSLVSPAGASEPLGLKSVSCVTPTQCVAIGRDAGGSFAMAGSGTSWGTHHDFGTDQLVLGVSCVAVGECTAVGLAAGGAIYVIESAGAWGSPVAIGNPGDGFLTVSCTSVGNCVAVGVAPSIGAPGNETAMFAIETSRGWSNPVSITQPSPGGGLLGVSCLVGLNCAAVGANSVQNAAVLSGPAGGWGNALSEIGPGIVGVLSAVSCVSAGTCTAVGSNAAQEAVFVRETAGAWDTTLSPLTGGLAVPRGISCTSAMECVAVGTDGSGNAGYVIESNGTWGALVAVPGGAAGRLTSVSCAIASYCSAVGNTAAEAPLAIGIGSPPEPVTTTTESTPHLPSTGSDSGVLVIVAVLMLGIGLLGRQASSLKNQRCRRA